MNLPVINPIVRNVPLDKIDSHKLFLDLSEKNFDGYCYLTVLGKYGFEESILILSKGQIVGSIFLITGYDVELYGKDAILYCLNSYGLNKGMLNIFALTQDQIKLILLFNEKIKYQLNISDKKKNSIFINLKYDEKKIELLLSEKIKTEISSKEIINNFNLNDLLRE
jgi:hypothetical protein